MAVALAVGRATLPQYAHRFAPHKFTQPQLFACLVLKVTTYTRFPKLSLLVDCSTHLILTDELTSRSYHAQNREMRWLAIVHNIMV